MELAPSDDEGWNLEPPEPISKWKTEEYKAKRRARMTSEHGRALLRAASKTENGRARQKRKQEHLKKSGWRARWAKTDKGRAMQKRAYDKKMADPGKKLMERIGVRMSTAIRDPSTDSDRLTKYTEFENSAAIVAHFESTFEDWMSWDNYGPYRVGKPRTWDIGHRIPLCKYDANDPADFRRCWTKANLFAQCSKENNQLKQTMPSQAVLDSLREIWPLAWC